MWLFYDETFWEVLAFVAATAEFIIAFAFIRHPSTGGNRFGKASQTRRPLQGVTNGIVHIFDVKGRANRIDFWSFAFFVALLCVLPPVLLMTTFIFADDQWFELSFLSFLMYPLLATPSLTMAIRRLHDINRSGWWLLLLLVFGYFILLYWFCQRPVANANERADIFE